MPVLAHDVRVEGVVDTVPERDAALQFLAAHIHAATGRLLGLIAELDRREVWAAQGALSCAHWLSWACGIDTHTAREKVRVARALTELPLLSEALAMGELGYSKVRALTRIATAGNEADLLNIGLHGTAQHVEKFVRLHRRAKRAEETERADAQHESRGLTFRHDDDGTVVLHGRFPPEMGARILSALDAAMAAHAAEQPATGWDNEGLAPEDVPAGTSRQEPSPADAAADAGARERATSHQREDAQVFLTDVPRGTFIRGPSRTVRRALSSRDHGCRFPGCPATHRLHGHHVTHWANGGETSLDNPILLCPTHHRLVHEGGFDVQRLDDGAFRFTNPRGMAIRPPRRRETSSSDTIVIQNEGLGLTIDCETATAHWHGERIDYDHALMMTMASWDSGDVRPEAGPAAGDWNPS